jgi:hypothetical protein
LSGGRGGRAGTSETNHRTVSADGKTMRVDIEGVDAQGKPVQGLELFDNQQYGPESRGDSVLRPRRRPRAQLADFASEESKSVRS